MQKKLWAKWSYETANLIVTFGYTLGYLPVKWNKSQNRMEPITSPLEFARWIGTILLVTIFEVVICINYFRNLVESEDTLALIKQDHFRFIIVGISVVGGCFHLHTAWKFQNFVAFINRAAGFYEFFQNNYARKRERRGYTKEDTISGMMKIGFLVGIVVVGCLFILAYLIRCRKHMLYYVLPICNSQYPLYIKIPLKILGSMAQFQFMAFNLAAVSLYVDLFAAVVLMGLYIVREMSPSPARTRRTKRRLLEPTNWFHAFRCLELIVHELNGCIGELFMPLHMLVIVLASAIAPVFLIRFDLGPMITAFLLLLLVGIALYYKLLIGRGSNFCEASGNALYYMRREMCTPYLVRKHRACTFLKPAVGSLFPLKRQTVATMYQTSVEMASEILLF